MELSLRLKTIASMVDRCNCTADIGTDHGYVPIELIKSGTCSKVIASDINKGPVKKANLNVILEDLQDKIECRLGPGLNTIKAHEVQGIIIAGMGGNLIRDIIEEGLDVFKECEFSILQPVQNPEILREYIYKSGYNIIDEELCIDENKFYEIIKIKYDNKVGKIDSIFYEVGKALIDKKHPLVSEFIKFKMAKYNKILNNIKDDTKLANDRKVDIKIKIQKLEELLKCL
ncbi:SAM-dependent methyltransferase [Clostridium sp. P21]|uniref:SAM-dependent methyltransferase n=1 Tax=Clostridium muellerianum TaxID=2716538 RepID=A0A7Y0EE93_9CLOT|nr:class I SAM-dependent methyltransferase [Clostridium muellerianum]NMM61924.1 SAM-dependent methyltransferase [Clostridium muellerianum]